MLNGLPSLVAILIAALSVWEILEIWHHSHLFAGWRARSELWDNKAGQLLSCMFCLAPWVSLLVVAALAASEHLTQHYSRWLGLAVAGPFYAFAIARLANLGNDVCHRICRTPKAGLDDLPDDEA
jgi:hypothetical protein